MSMETLEGALVRSLAGHDKGKLFRIAEVQGEFFLVTDGKSRKLGAPKRKRNKHVEFVGGPELRIAQPASDKQLRCALARARDALSGDSKGQGGNHAWQKTI